MYRYVEISNFDSVDTVEENIDAFRRFGVEYLRGIDEQKKKSSDDDGQPSVFIEPGGSSLIFEKKKINRRIV